MQPEMTFGEALLALQDGKRVARKGWNGKDQWLVMLFAGNLPLAYQEFDVVPCIGMKTVHNKMQPGWLASQADMLARDWEIVG